MLLFFERVSTGSAVSWEGHIGGLHGYPSTDNWLSQTTTLWQEVAALSDSRQAWASVVSVMIRDPAFWMY